MPNDFSRGSTSAIISAADQYAIDNGLPTSSQYSGANTGIRGSHILDVGLFTGANGIPDRNQQLRRDFIDEIYDGQNQVFDVNGINNVLVLPTDDVGPVNGYYAAQHVNGSGVHIQQSVWQATQFDAIRQDFLDGDIDAGIARQRIDNLKDILRSGTINTDPNKIIFRYTHHDTVFSQNLSNEQKAELHQKRLESLGQIDLDSQNSIDDLITVRGSNGSFVYVFPNGFTTFDSKLGAELFSISDGLGKGSVFVDALTFTLLGIGLKSSGILDDGSLGKVTDFFVNSEAFMVLGDVLDDLAEEVATEVVLSGMAVALGVGILWKGYEVYQSYAGLRASLDFAAQHSNDGLLIDLDALLTSLESPISGWFIEGEREVTVAEENQAVSEFPAEVRANILAVVNSYLNQHFSIPAQTDLVAARRILELQLEENTSPPSLSTLIEAAIVFAQGSAFADMSGTSTDDVLIGTDFDDFRIGGDGEDWISGAGGNDTLDGGDNSDLLFGGSGNDSLIGGADFDVLRLLGTRNDYTFVQGSGKQIVVTSLNTNEGTDTISGIEAVSFDGEAASVLIGDLLAMPDDDGNLPDATNITGQTVVNDQVDGRDFSDWYSFTAFGDGAGSISLTGLNADVDLFLYNEAGALVIRSTNSEATSELVNFSYTDGEGFYVRVATADFSHSYYTLTTGFTSTSTPTTLGRAENDVRTFGTAQSTYIVYKSDILANDTGINGGAPIIQWQNLNPSDAGGTWTDHGTYYSFVPEAGSTIGVMAYAVPVGNGDGSWATVTINVPATPTPTNTPGVASDDQLTFTSLQSTYIIYKSDLFLNDVGPNGAFPTIIDTDLVRGVQGDAGGTWTDHGSYFAFTPANGSTTGVMAYAIDNGSGGEWARVTVTVPEPDPSPTQTTLVQVGDASIVEGGTLAFELALDYAASTPVTINFTISDPGGNLPGTTPLSGSVIIAAGQQTGFAYVTTANDLDSDTEQVFLNVTGISGAVLSSDTSGIGTIVDDDTPSELELRITSFDVREGSGLTMFAIDIPYNPRNQTVTFDYRIESGTATEGVDFANYNFTGNMSIASDDVRRLISINTFNDTLYEGNETVRLVIENVQGGSITQTEFFGTIVDDDQPVITTRPELFVASASLTSSLIEVGDPLSVEFIIDNSATVRASNSETGVFLSSDSIRGNADDVFLFDITMDIDPNEADHELRTLSIVPTLTSGTYFVFVEANYDRQITEVTYSNNLSTPMQFTVVEPPDPTIHALAVSMAEGEVATLKVDLSRATSEDIVLDYVVQDDDGIEVQSGRISIPAGSTIGTARLSVPDNTAFNGAAEFTFAIIDVVSGSVILGTASALVSVRDDEAPTFTTGNDSIILPEAEFAYQARSGEGNDSVTGSSIDDRIFGEQGRDTLSGAAGNDVLNGGGGSDLLIDGNGADLFQAGSGNDVIQLEGVGRHTAGYVAYNVSAAWQVGTDVRLALEGMVRLEAVTNGGSNYDTVRLSSGDDAFFLHDAFSGFHQSVGLSEDYTGNNSAARFSNIEQIDALAGDDIIDLTSPDYSLAGVELQINAGAGNDVVWGSDANETIDGGAGNDTIFGGAGNDVVWGSDANETIDGGAGNDTIFGGAGDDVLRGGSGADVFEFTRTSGGQTVADFDASEGDSLRFYDTGNTEFLAHSVLLTAAGFQIDYRDTATNEIRSLELSVSDNGANPFATVQDVLSVVEIRGEGNGQILLGSNADDLLAGTSFSDTFISGAGNDTLTGGSGADVFLFEADNGTKTITDFDASEDQIIVRIDFSGGGSGPDGNNFNLSYREDNGDNVRIVFEDVYAGVTYLSDEWWAIGNGIRDAVSVDYL